MIATNNQRQLNIELLRIFSMLLITFWHVQIHYLIKQAIEPSISKTFMDHAVLFISFHVDLFILITGYFGIKNSKKGLVKNLLLVYFYSISLNVFSWIISGQYSISEALMPLGNKTWWFMTMYTVMLMIAPILEFYINKCTRKDIYMLALGGLFVNLYFGHFHHVDGIYDLGNGMVNFICVYLLGVWIRKEGACLIGRLKYPKMIFSFIIIILLLAQYKAIPFVSWMDMTEYCAPYPIVMSVLVFLFFLTIKVTECFRKPTMFLSSSAIAVYLITDHIAVRELLKPLFFTWFLPYQHSIMGLVIIVASTMIAYIGACIIDQMRIPVTKYLNTKILRMLGD